MYNHPVTLLSRTKPITPSYHGLLYDHGALIRAHVCICKAYQLLCTDTETFFPKTLKSLDVLFIGFCARTTCPHPPITLSQIAIARSTSTSPLFVFSLMFKFVFCSRHLEIADRISILSSLCLCDITILKLSN